MSCERNSILSDGCVKHRLHLPCLIQEVINVAPKICGFEIVLSYWLELASSCMDPSGLGD